jgi:hypothetical protein
MLLPRWLSHLDPLSTHLDPLSSRISTSDSGLRKDCSFSYTRTKQGHIAEISLDRTHGIGYKSFSRYYKLEDYMVGLYNIISPT